jgi:hypothetical protein
VPQFVRAALRTNRWLETEDRAPHDFPADVVTDLGTKGDQLSVYEVTGSVSAERIAIAVAAGKNNPDHTGYAVFDRAPIESLGITINKTPGGTHDATVNAANGTSNNSSLRVTAAIVNDGTVGGTVSWNLRNQRNREVASGVYLIVLEGPGGKAVRKVAVMR